MIPTFVYNPPNSPLEVLYVDDHIVVVNKPSGLLSVPGRAKEHWDCLSYRLSQHYPEVRTVHRLDMDTSGVMVFALSKDSNRALSRQFEMKEIEKEYVARVDGLVQDDEGVIDLALRCDWDNRPLQMVDPVLGKKALTRYQVLERDPARNESRLLLLPLTGRSHQLRVHCLSMGHVIIGDIFYAPKEIVEKEKRLCLHAQALSFSHPDTQQKMTFRCDADF